jgi:hypothetical protein
MARLTDILLDGAGTTFRHKLRNAVRGYDDGSLEYLSHLELIGNLKSRTIDAALGELEQRGEALVNSLADAAIDLATRESIEFVKKKTPVKSVIELEDKVQRGIDKFLKKVRDFSIVREPPNVEEAVTTVTPPIGDETPTQAAQRSIVARRRELVSPLLKWEKENVGSYPTLEQFYTKIAGTDQRFSLLQTYFFYVSIDFENVTQNESTLQYALEKEIKKFDKDAIRLLARRANLPNVVGDNSITVINQFGHMSLPADRIIPDANDLTLGFMNGEYAIHENLLMEWMKQTAADRYLYPNVPFRKATITVDFINQTFDSIPVTYKFIDTFPDTVATIDGDHGELTELTREVKFKFDFMQVITGKIKEAVSDDLRDINVNQNVLLA